MAQYEIKFDPVRESCGQLETIRKALEECSDKLSQMSRNVQEGLEREAEKMAQWSKFTSERADDVHRSSVCLETSLENLLDAEKLTYERLQSAGATPGGGEAGSGDGKGSGSGSGDGKDTDLSDGGDAAATPGGSGEGQAGSGIGGDAAATPGGSGEGQAGSGTDSANILLPDGPFLPWDNRRSDWLDRKHMFELVDLRMLMPILMPIMWTGSRALRGDIWALLQAYLGRRHGASDGTGGVSGEGGETGEGGGTSEGGGTDEDGISSDIETGRGVIDLSEEGFADAEANVDAEMGCGESAIEPTDDSIYEPTDESIYEPTDESASELAEEVAFDVVDGLDFDPEDESTIALPDEPEDESTIVLPDEPFDEFSGEPVIRPSGGSRGGSRGGSQSGEPMVDQGTGFSEPVVSQDSPPNVEVEPGYIKLEDEIEKKPLKVNPETNTTGSSQGAVNTTPPSRGAPPVSDIIEKAKGGGAAAPIIGAASVASIAAAGVGISGGMGGNNSGGSGESGQKPEPPVIAAKESGGVFSGNLKGEYGIIGTSVALLFAGGSITAGVVSNKNKGKPDDRFRIGYGTSAVISGGAMQERS